MLRIRNPFKKGEDKRCVKELSIGELAWKSINLENELKVSKKMEVS